jgi:hypothetical protein
MPEYKSKRKSSKYKGKGGKMSKFECDAFTKLTIDTVSTRRSNRTTEEAPMNLKCAPGKGTEFSDGSCFSTPVVVEMVRAYNKANPDNAIKDTKWSTAAEYRKYLLGKLAKRLAHLCDDEMCWLAQDFIKLMRPTEQAEAVNDSIRPHGPGGQFKWLGTTNIDDVMRQYESVYKDFYFMGAVPSDFDKWEDIGQRGVKYKGFPIEYIESLLDKGIKKFGIVFNTDDSDQPGQHWISAYADANTGLVAFFDSAEGKNNEPDPRIRTFLARFEEAFKKRGIPAEYKLNKTKFQYKNTECGVYSINFILRMVDDGDFDEIVANPIDDDTVNKCRVVYFGNKL